MASEPPAARLRITSQPPTNAVVGQHYEATLTASGGKGPYAWKIKGNQPTGLKIDGRTGVLSGVPKKAGTYTFRVSVSDETRPKQRVDQEVTLIVRSAEIEVMPAKLSKPKAGRPYTAVLEATGGTAPYTFTMDGGTVNGLSLSSDGRLTGVPERKGEFTITVNVTDADGTNGRRQYTLSVN